MPDYFRATGALVRLSSASCSSRRRARQRGAETQGGRSAERCGAPEHCQPALAAWPWRSLLGRWGIRPLGHVREPCSVKSAPGSDDSCTDRSRRVVDSPQTQSICLQQSARVSYRFFGLAIYLQSQLSRGKQHVHHVAERADSPTPPSADRQQAERQALVGHVLVLRIARLGRRLALPHGLCARGSLSGASFGSCCTDARSKDG